MQVKIGDLVKTIEEEIVGTTLRRGDFGVVIEVEKERPAYHQYVRVHWWKGFGSLWCQVRNLEVVSESR